MTRRHWGFGGESPRVKKSFLIASGHSDRDVGSHSPCSS
jgi:hypothetical protein